jgi:hypothetical protein
MSHLGSPRYDLFLASTTSKTTPPANANPPSMEEEEFAREFLW